MKEPLPGWVPAPFAELLRSMRAADRARRPANGRELCEEVARLAVALPELGAESAGPAAESRSAKERAVGASALPFVGNAEARRALDAALASSAVVSVVGSDGSGRSRLVRDAVFGLQLERAKSGGPLPSYRVVKGVPVRLTAEPTIWHVVDADEVDPIEVERFGRAAALEPSPSVLVLERTLPLARVPDVASAADAATNVRALAAGVPSSAREAAAGPGASLREAVAGSDSSERERADAAQVDVHPLARAEVAQLLAAALGGKAKLSAEVIDEAAAVSGGLAAHLCRVLAAGLAASKDLTKVGAWRDVSSRELATTSEGELVMSPDAATAGRAAEPRRGRSGTVAPSEQHLPVVGREDHAPSRSRSAAEAEVAASAHGADAIARESAMSAGAGPSATTAAASGAGVGAELSTAPTSLASGAQTGASPAVARAAAARAKNLAVALLRSLPALAREIVELLAVAGGSLPFDRLQPAAADDKQLAEALQLLCALGVATRASDGKLRLRPDVARESWAQLGRARRAEIANAIVDGGAQPGAAKSAAAGARAQPIDPRADAHLAAARGNRADAAKLFATSVQRALASGDPALANELANEATQLLGGEQTLQLAALQAEALRAQASYAAAEAVLTPWLDPNRSSARAESETHARERDEIHENRFAEPTAAELRALRLLRSEIRRLRGDASAAREDAQILLDTEDKASTSAVALGASVLLARLSLDSGDLERAEREARRVLDEAGDDPRGLRAAEVLSLALLQRGDESGAQTILEPALTAARARGERAAEARLWSVSGSRQKLAGHLRAAAISFGRAFELADAAGEFHAAASFLVNLGTARLDAGELGNALDTLRGGARRLARLGRDRDVGRTLYNLALARQLIGDYPDAWRVAEHAEAAAARAGDLSGAVFAAILRAETAKERGEVDAARQQLEALPDLTRLPAAQRVAVESRAAVLCAELGDETAANTYLTRAEVGAEQSGADDVELGLARAAWFGLKREAREAQREAERALARANERGEFALHVLALSAAARAAEQRGDANLMRARLSELRSQLDTAALTLGSTDRARLREVRAYRAALAAAPAAAIARNGSPANDAASGGDARFRRLAGIAKRLTAETHRRSLYQLLLDSAIDLTYAESGFLMLRDAEGELRVRAGRTLGERDQAERGISQSIVQRVVASGQALSTVDAIRDERLSGASSVHALALRSVLVVPLRSGTEILGVIYLDDRLRHFAFGDDEVALLSDLADLAAIAIEGMERLRRERRAVRRLRATQTELARQLEAQAIELASWKGAKQLAGEHAGIVAHSARMRDTLELALRVARSDVPVLIRGESGTGKELIAKAIHAASARKDAPFVSENCGAIPESLLESTLFGHVKGAFTGADRRHHGLFEAAHGGTLFLDEIGEMSPSMQVRLLRVLQDGEVRPIGGERATKVDVRVLCATHRDVDAMLERGGFREDLYYRLAVVSLDLPSLRERSEDILPLVQHFLAKYAPNRATKIDKRALERLASFAWPGNVRQLENEMRRALALASGETLREEHFSVLTPRSGATEVTDLDLRAHVDELERKLIKRALESARGNQTRAAEMLGVSRFGLQKMLKRLFPTPADR